MCGADEPTTAPKRVSPVALQRGCVTQHMAVASGVAPGAAVSNDLTPGELLAPVALFCAVLGAAACSMAAHVARTHWLLPLACVALHDRERLFVRADFLRHNPAMQHYDHHQRGITASFCTDARTDKPVKAACHQRRRARPARVRGAIKLVQGGAGVQALWALLDRVRGVGERRGRARRERRVVCVPQGVRLLHKVGRQRRVDVRHGWRAVLRVVHGPRVTRRPLQRRLVRGEARPGEERIPRPRDR